MTLSLRTLAILAGVGALIVGALAIPVALERHRLLSDNAKLRNDLAKSDTTHKLAEGVYARATQTATDLASLLDTRDSQVRELTAQLASAHAQLLTASTVTLTTAPVEGSAVAVQSEVRDPPNLLSRAERNSPSSYPPPPRPWPGENTAIPAVSTLQLPATSSPRLRVDFSQTFGQTSITGYTLTSPAEAWVSIHRQPLRLTLAVSQLPDGSWRTYATSSDPDTAVDIGVTAVNPRLLEPRWYERLSVRAEAGVGAGVGLVGLGVGVGFGRWEVGPSAWGIVGLSGPKTAYGASVSWRPWGR